MVKIGSYPITTEFALTLGRGVRRRGPRARCNVSDPVRLVDVVVLEGCAPQAVRDGKGLAIDHVRAYNLSKEAVIVLTIAETEALFARGLRMNTVSPAAVSTGILDDFVTAFGERVAKNIARAGRPGLPDEVADVILFLASPESRWLKGIDIPVDGGMGAMAVSDMIGLAPNLG